MSLPWEQMNGELEGGREGRKCQNCFAVLYSSISLQKYSV